MRGIFAGICVSGIVTRISPAADVSVVPVEKIYAGPTTPTFRYSRRGKHYCFVRVLELTLLFLDEPIEYTRVHLLSDLDSEDEETGWRVAQNAGGSLTC